MRHTLRDIVNGGTGCCEDHPYVHCGGVMQKCHEAFNAWKEPEDESALSEKEGKNRGCC